ncbi:unnamed protein product [Polarella glacialis]|uniref:Uncharacterized protein n=1 Tax=Polarella glacialis TaxID=89957 RepID=A0A813GPS7_POLGL|nr:unnamed protein product [Polarella glacialis]
MAQAQAQNRRISLPAIMILDFDKLFARIKLGSKSDIGWTKLELSQGDDHGCEDFKMTYHHPFPGVTVLRGQFMLETSVPAQVLFPRPEWLCLPSYKQCQEFFEMELDHMVAPGDAIVSVTRADPADHKASEMTQIRALMAVLAGSHEKAADDPQTQSSTFKARLAVRWDLPEIGSTSHIVAPLDPISLQPVSELGMHKAILSVFQQHPTEANKVRVSKAIVVSGTVPPWAGSQFRKLLMIERERLLKIASLPFMHNLRTEGKDFYLVVSLKCCVRGPPLLPCGETEEADTISRVCLQGQAIKYWERLERLHDDNFSLCSYLKKFLSTTGLAVNVFGNFDGRELVSYQAFVQRSQWDAIRPEFEKAWRTHGAAYRRLNGGSAAPKLVEGSVSRWKPCEENAERFNDGCPLSQMRGNCVTIRNTFIEVVDCPESPVGWKRTLSF